MDSYISQYNDLVEKKCKEELKVKKNKEMKNANLLCTIRFR